MYIVLNKELVCSRRLKMQATVKHFLRQNLRKRNYLTRVREFCGVSRSSDYCGLAANGRLERIWNEAFMA